MGNPVNFFQITATDGGPLMSFYKQVFSWKTSTLPDGTMMVASEKGGIAGGVGSSQNGGRNGHHCRVQGSRRQLDRSVAGGEEAGQTRAGQARAGQATAQGGAEEEGQ